MKKIALIIFVLGLFLSKTFGQVWSELGGFNSLAENDIILSICNDSMNNFYVSGWFTNASGKHYVAKWDGSVWSELGGLNGLSANDNINSTIIDLNGNLYAAGKFRNSSYKRYVAKWDGNAWSELGGLNALNANNEIYTLCKDNFGNIYAAGSFTNASGKKYVAKWNGSMWSELGGLNGLSANSIIESICSDTQGNIYAAGHFTNTNGTAYVAKWNGLNWSVLGTSSLGLNANAAIMSLNCDSSGLVYAAGYFTGSGGKYVAVWNGASWSELGLGNNALGANGCIYKIYKDYLGNIYAAGFFTNANGNTYVAKWNGNTWIEVGGINSLASNSIIRDICGDSYGNIYAVGNFTNTAGNEYVAKIDLMNCSPNSTNINASVNTVCPNQPTTLTAYSDSGSTYYWLGYGNGSSITANPISTTNFTVITTNSVGCDDTTQISINVYPLPNVQLTSSTDTICQGNSITLTASGANTYTANWLQNGNSYATLTPNNSQNYSVIGTDANGCSKSITKHITVNSSNFNVQFAIVGSQIINANTPSQFNNTTANSSQYTFYWNYGDGTIVQSNNPSVFHTYTNNGNFDVSLIAIHNSTGCSDTLYRTGYVFVSGGVTCPVVAYISATITTSCSGDSLLLQANSGTGYTYQWRKNSVTITGATFQTYYAKTSGNYSVVVSDANCSSTSTNQILNFITQPSIPTITQSGSINLCSGGSITLNASNGYSSYNWSNGSNAQTTNVTQSGTYSVTVIDVQGCTNTGSYTVNAAIMQPTEICLVGIDSISNKNILVWDKPITTAIDSFIVFKETNVANQFGRITAQSYSAFSTFIDNASAPQTQAYRYKLAIRDSCGLLSSLSNFHKTIHLSINVGVGTSWNLIWNNYEGVIPTTYNIYRGTSSNNLTLLTSLAASNTSLNSYTDLSSPSGLVYYQIELVNALPCSPSKSNNANFISSKSNVASTGNVGLNSLEVEAGFKIYPNPAHSILNIEFGSKTLVQGSKLSITDVLGNEIPLNYLPSTNYNILTINIVSFAKGIYFIKVGNNVKKLLVE